jgi:hypothetical protein
MSALAGDPTATAIPSACRADSTAPSMSPASTCASAAAANDSSNFSPRLAFSSPLATENIFTWAAMIFGAHAAFFAGLFSTSSSIAARAVA